MDVIPEEILEYIMSFLSPYQDLITCTVVSKKWNRVARGVAKVVNTSLARALQGSGHLECTVVTPSFGPSIAERFSHSSCYYNKSMYVFGGCTSNCTTFNDLWRFDLVTREWIRPLAMGTYPSPKASASLVCHDDRLILFGGYSPPGQFPFYQSSLFNKRVHVYCPETNKWTCISTPSGPLPMAGHSATVISDCMIVFGGCQGAQCFNDVWSLNLGSFEWSLVQTSHLKPMARYGQSQILLDKDNLLIVGGCGGPNKVYSDVWLLRMNLTPWTWQEMHVLLQEDAAPKMWCHQACKVGSSVVLLSKSRKSASANTASTLEFKRAPRVWVPPRDDRATHAGRSRSDAQQRLRRGSAGCLSSSSDEGDAKPPTHPRRHSEQEVKPAVDAAGSRDPSADASASSAPCGDLPAPGCSHWSGDDDDEPMEADDAAAAAATTFKVPRLVGATPAPPRLVGATPAPPRLAGATPAPPCPAGATVAPPCPAGGTVAPPCPAGATVAPLRFAGATVAPLRLAADRTPLPAASQLSVTSRGMPSVRPNAMRDRERQLEGLRRMEERIRAHSRRRGPADAAPQPRSSSSHAAAAVRNPMRIYVLDVSAAASEGRVAWLRDTDALCGALPEETAFHSLVVGRGELVMFGGIQMDTSRMSKNVEVSQQALCNNVYIITAASLYVVRYT
ncbi:PREDICTED: F-box only protein 42-like [Priapulus caudatus]|uniref:F-box only protein 42-like n=1 Tax=Priapulus caudatus TaxID=37621 RepID=A0ABM1ET89_PRICU|nr:PREDICTED: F-box only protein 42-like [Priapulus caudatus]